METKIDENIIEFLKESNAIEEVHDADSLAQAIYAWNYLTEQSELNPGIVLKTHKILSLHSSLRPDEKGYLRRVPVYIGGKEGKPWYALPELIKNWCDKMNTDRHLNKEKELHIEYEYIHPFIDFNGRTGRLFLNWYRLQIGASILIIKKTEVNNYYNWFH